MTMPLKRTDPRDTAASLPDVLQFMQLLWAVVHGLEKTSKRMAGDLGVTGPQRLALRVIGLFPGVSAGDLAATLHVHPSTLTARGARINAARRGTVESAVADVLDGVSAQDREATMRVLERLARQLGSPAEKGVGRGSSSRPNQSRGKKGG
jgi:DNA-binding MarR family transcriptional regulator